MLHWDGTAWHAGTLPHANARPTFASATSPSDVWAGGGFCGGGPGQPPIAAYVSRWNGQSWATKLFRHITWCVQGLVTTRYNDGWLFTSESFALHLHRGQWHKVRLGNVGTVITATAISPSNVWAFTFRSSDKKALAIHWNGHTWQTVPLPRVALPRGKFMYPYTSYSSRATGIWLSEAAVPNVSPSLLLHWTGHSWRQVATPGKSIAVAMTSDGGRGLWCVGWSPLNATVSYSFLQRANNSWNRQAVPVSGLPGNPTQVDLNVYDISIIPGTQSLWATGDVDYTSMGTQKRYAVIYKFSH